MRRTGGVMPVPWFRKDKESVHNALGRRKPPVMATTMACGPLDESVALHIESSWAPSRPWIASRSLGGARSGPTRSQFHTSATLPLLCEPALDPAARLVFPAPAILLRLGRTTAQIQEGTTTSIVAKPP